MKKKIMKVIALIIACIAVIYLILTLQNSSIEEASVSAKPVIYLYPEEETEVNVKLEYDGELTCTYPAYDNG